MVARSAEEVQSLLAVTDHPDVARAAGALERLGDHQNVAGVVLGQQDHGNLGRGTHVSTSLFW